MTARFVVIEGVDGAGKTTQADALLGWMRSQGREPVHLREPGTTSLGERLRALLLDPAREDWSARAEAILFFAARRELLTREVAPALAAGRDVVCERFTPSTLAYQGQDPADAAFILELDRVVVGAQQPDCVLLLDLDPAESLARAQARTSTDGLDGMERRGLAFLEAVRRGYLAYAEARPEITRVIDCNGRDRDAVQQALRAHLQPYFQPKTAPGPE